MTFLFILALIFTIPTYGLSLLAYFVLVVIQGILKAKARMHYVDTQRALRGESIPLRGKKIRP